MVLTELLPLLAAKGLDTSKVGFIGWSMGGYGVATRSPAGPGPDGGDLRGEPGAVLLLRQGRGIRRVRQSRGRSEALGVRRPGTRRSRSGWIAVRAIRFYLATGALNRVASLRRPPSGVSSKVVTTFRPGAGSCPPNWRGWLRRAPNTGIRPGLVGRSLLE